MTNRRYILDDATPSGYQYWVNVYTLPSGDIHYGYPVHGADASRILAKSSLIPRAAYRIHIIPKSPQHIPDEVGLTPKQRESLALAAFRQMITPRFNGIGAVSLEQYINHACGEMRRGNFV